MKTAISRVFRFLTGGLLLAAAAVTPGSAEAAVYGKTGTYANCSPTGSPDLYVNGGNNSSANTLILTCPTTDSSDIPHNVLSTLALFYQDQSSGPVMVARCVDYETVVGTSCGNLAQSAGSGTGFGNLQPPNTPASFATDWNAGNFAYQLVYLPPKNSSGGMSTIRGLYEKRL